MALGTDLNAAMFRSLSLNAALQHLADNYLGQRIPNSSLRILAHSWGAATAIHLAWRMKKLRAFSSVRISALAFIDPVCFFRREPTTVPDNVDYLWNRYQTSGLGVTIMGFPVYGCRVHSSARESDQLDLNPGPGDNGIDHWSIIEHVKPAVKQILG